MEMHSLNSVSASDELRKYKFSSLKLIQSVPTSWNATFFMLEIFIWLSDICMEVNQLNLSVRCQFVKVAEDCENTLSYIDYTRFMYCTLGPHGTYGAVCIGFLWLLVLFVALGLTATDFLCPSLFVISKTLRLSQNIAGVTLLAFGNGAPDIFSAVAGIRQGRPELVIGGLFGGGLFTTTVVAGTIFLMRSFQLECKPFVRDVFFYVAATAWTFTLFFTGGIRLRDAIGFICVYVIYVILVVVSKFFQKSEPDAPTSEECDATPSDSSHDAANGTSKGFEENGHVVLKGFVALGDDMNPGCKPPPPCKQPVAKRPSIFVIPAPTSEKEKAALHRHPSGRLQPRVEPRRMSLAERGLPLTEESLSVEERRKSVVERRLSGIERRLSQNPDVRRLSQSPEMTSVAELVRNAEKQHEKYIKTENGLVPIPSEEELMPSPFLDFLIKICPVNLITWPNKSWASRALEISKAPIYFLLLITTPVANVEQKTIWCRYLSVIHCLTGPLFIIFASGNGLVMLGSKVPLSAAIVPFCVVLAVVVFFTSKDDVTPVYEDAFAYLGFLVAVTWIYCISNEIVCLLRAAGIVFSLSDAIIGLTILAWGNCLLDFLANISVSRKGFPQMGIAACFGSPLLTLLIGVGVPCLVRILGEPTSEDRVVLNYSTLIAILYGALCVSLVSTFVKMLVCRFQVWRPYGAGLVLLYVIVLIGAILVETGVV